MPVFIAAFLGGLINVAGTIAGQVMIGLGISVLTYSGLSTTLDWLKAGAIANFHALPSSVLNILSVLKVGPSVSMVFSAIVVHMTLQGLTSGTVKKWITK